MLDLIILYFIFGDGFYVGLCCNNSKGFVGADCSSILRGVLIGLIFWPIGLIYSIVRELT